MRSGQGQGRVHFSEFCCSSTLLSKPKQTFLSLSFPPPTAYICRHLSISAGFPHYSVCRLWNMCKASASFSNISAKKKTCKSQSKLLFFWFFILVLPIRKLLLQYLSTDQIVIPVRLCSYLTAIAHIYCLYKPLLWPIKPWWVVLTEADCLLFPLLYCPPLMSWFPLRGVQARALPYSSCRPSVKIATSDWLASCHQGVTFEAPLLLLLRATWEILMCKTRKGTASLLLSFLWFLTVHWQRVQAFQGSCLEGKQKLISRYFICSIKGPACCLPYVWKGQFWYLLFPKWSFWLVEIL